MSNPERHQQESLPRVNRDALETFVQRPADFKGDFTALLRENPDLARAITIRLDNEPERLAFARGALWMYTILREAVEVRQLERLFDGEPFSGGDDGEGLPLSA